MIINIKGFDRVSVFMALYDAARPQGMGLLHYVEGPMPRAEAEMVVRWHEDHGQKFDYVRGRVMKVRLNKDTFDAWAYDRDNGEGAALAALAAAGIPAYEVLAEGAE